MCPTVFSKHKGLVVHYVELMRIFRTLGDSSFASLSLLLEGSKLLSCCTQPCESSHRKAPHASDLDGHGSELKTSDWKLMEIAKVLDDWDPGG